MLLAFTFIFGFIYSGCYSACSTIFLNWIDIHNIGFLSAIWNGSLNICGVIVYYISFYITNIYKYNWRYSYYFYTFLFIILGTNIL